jgi:hypothetical protein
MANNTKTILVIDDEPQTPIEQNIQSALKAEFNVQFVNVDASSSSVLNENLDVDAEKLKLLIAQTIEHISFDLVLVDYNLGENCPFSGLVPLKYLYELRPSTPRFLYSAIQKDVIKEVVGNDLNNTTPENIINGINQLMDMKIAKICSRPAYPQEVIKYLRQNKEANPRSILIAILRENRDRIFNSCCPPLKGKTFGEVADILDDVSNGLGNEWMMAIMEQIAAYLAEVNE